ncbi:NRPS [Trichoderma virens]|nr:NRPS [Trichoderma virens]
MAARLVDVEPLNTERSQLLNLIIHPVIADHQSLLVLLNDLQTLLQHGSLGPKPASFQAWVLGQFNDSQRRPSDNTHFASSRTIQTDFSGYWGLKHQSNTFSGVKSSDIIIDADTTSLLLGKANGPLRTETVEILLAALCGSFADVFTDRSPPKVFCARSDRDTAAGDNNISSTVGCFTTISTIYAEDHMAASSSIDLETRTVNTLRSVKDQRRFVHSGFTGLEEMEILLTYTENTYLETPLFQQIPTDKCYDIIQHQTRQSFIEVSAEVIHGQLNVNFFYHKDLLHQKAIISWIQTFKDLLSSSASILTQIKPIPTLSDFPLLAIKDYASLDSLFERCRSQMQIPDISAVESIHRCSPMQEGILLSTLRSTNIYDGQEFWRVLPKSSSESIDMSKLEAACKSVIGRHDILRTHFVEVHHGRAAFLQVTLREVNPPVRLTTFNDLDDLMHQPLPQLHDASILPYFFTLCKLATGDIYLRLDISHAISDGVSTGILMRDLLLAYDGRLSPTGPSYKNYMSHLESQSAEQKLQFWKDNLKDATPYLFPLLNESRVGNPPVHQSTSVQLSTQQKDQVREFCKLHNTTLANFMSAIWAMVLPCFSDASSDTATFGYLALGRDIPLSGVDDILGPMITMLIRSVNVNPETTVLQLIEDMQQDFIKSWPHQHCSLGEIHHALGLNGTPLFNTIVNLGNAGGFRKTENVPSGILFVPENVQSRSEYDIAFNILDSDEGFWLTLSYWDRCLSEAHATVLSHTIQAAISSVLEKPEQRISDVALVDNFHMQLMQSWNADIPEPILDCIHYAFERQVKLQPEAPAICSSDPKISISYEQLDYMANKLAHSLRDIGVGPESLVPFCMDKSPWTPVAMIAILKAGGACVALNPGQPIQRLEGIINASNTDVVLVAPQHKDLLAGIVPHIVLVGEESLKSLQLSTQAFQPMSTASQENHTNPAFVIFTSGSTGTPKGIVVEHGAFCSSARSHAPILGLHSGTRVLQFASYTYDLSIAETFTTLMVGGCICVPSEYDRLNRLAAAINGMEVEWMFLTPTVAALLQPEQVPTVRTLVLGGEHATQNNFSSWGGRPGICLINSYGPAECSIWTNANVGVKPTSDISNLGRRLGCSLWVVDPRNHHRLFPMYARGELVIGGPTLARGYLHDPVKTDAAFIQPPAWFSEHSDRERRFYKSGDLVYYTLDGSLSIQGRKDTQVKVHGHRIELDDINHNMARIPLIEHAMTQLPRTGPLEGRLVAVASLKEDRPLASSPQQTLKIISDSNHMKHAATKLGQIRSELEKQLPKHMLPTVWVIVQKMPLLSSGKLDKRTVNAWLDAMDEEAYAQIKAMLTSDTAPMLAQPENDTESLLQKVWSEVLKCESSTIGMTVSFLGLGGDSILAMRAISTARAAGINIFVQDIFRLKTIRKLAEHASIAGTVDQPIATPGCFTLLPTKGPQQLTRLINDCVSILHLDGTGVGIEDIFPCSPMQEGILISQARSPDRYHVRALFEVLVQPTELVDVERLEQAWIKVAQRHQALRSVFLEEALGGEVLKLECQRLEEFSESIEVNQYAKDGPPYRFSICKLPSGVVYCHLSMTHALDDGSSMRVLLRDVCLAYDDLLPRGDPPLYSNFISYIQRQPKDAGLKFWQSYLNGATPTHFPVLKKPVLADASEDGIVERWIEGDKTSSLLRLCEEHEITIADVFKTIWAIVLRSFVGTDSVCFGYLASGRDAPISDVHNIMGPLINMLIFHTHIDETKSLLELCKEANDSYLEALPHQHCSLKEILHAVRGPGQSAALFNTVVNVQKGVTAFFVDEQDSTAHRTIDLRSRIFHDPTEYELSIDVQNFESSIVILMNYWTSLLSVEQANRLADLVVAVVERLVDDPIRTVGELELRTSGDAALLSSWNHAPLVEEGRCLHEVIEEQVASKPDAVAIVSDEGSLTFHQLDGMANRLAHHLVQLGAGPEVIIPCCFEKSIWAIVAMLGVLKAGAACAALDPAHPLERLQTILKDTQAPFILSSSSQTALAAQTNLQAVVVTEETLNKLSFCASAPITDVKPDNKAFIVYTSGSTGTLKGTILEHRNLYASSRGFGMFGMNSESRVAHFSSYAFDVSIGETILALTHGACVCIISEEDGLGDLTSALNRLQATFTQLTPTVVRTLEPSELPYMRTVVTAGELLTNDIINKWTDKVQLFNSYGPCECAINSTGTDLLKADARGAVIGKPLQSRLWIVDPENDQLLVPPGAVGELVVNGPIVGRGYLNNPDRTKAAFMDMPRWANASVPVGRFYKTGDLARWTSDGNIYYLGRKDVQVKIHGQRIELGETLYQGGGISVIDDVDLKSRLLAEFADITESVKKSLPRHMVPSLWIPVHNVPKLPSGKTNRRFISQWLEEMSQELHTELTTSSQPRIVPPNSDMEAMLQRIWGDILHLDSKSISTDQSFFSLAGDSVLAMQLMAHCRAEGVIVKVRDIFQYTTIASLAPRFTREMGELYGVSGEHMPQKTIIEAEQGDLDLDDVSNIEAVYPSSPMQRSILTIQETQRNAWFASFIVEAELPTQHRPTQLEDLTMSWQMVVNRHSIVRTAFRTGKHTDRYYQIKLKKFSAPVSYITDASSADHTSIFNVSPNIPEFGLPPHHLVLAEATSAKRVFIQLQISHALYDAVGISVLWHDFQVAYSSVRGGGVALDSMPVFPYQNFISYIDNLPKPSALNFWKNHLDGFSPCFFPSLSYERSDQAAGAAGPSSVPTPLLYGSFNSIAIPINRIDKIRAFCKEQAATTANLFQTAWALVLRQFTKSDDVSFGFMLSGRDAPLPEVDTILGPLINLLPCTVKASDHKTLRSMLRDLQSNYAETLINQNCSLEEIRIALGVEGPLYNTFLNMQRVTRQSPCSQSSIQFKEIDAFMADEYAISVYVSDVGDDVFMELSYWTSILSDEDAKMIGQALLKALDLLFDAKATDVMLSLTL